MASLGCLRHRSLLDAHIDRALGSRRMAAVARHVERCASCRRTAEELRRLRSLARSLAPGEAEMPDWSGFWPTVKLRIQQGGVPAVPLKDPWWLPVWKPVWGHPRVAMAGIVAGLIALALSLQPFGPGRPPTVAASPMVIQDATTSDPNASVMVYSGDDDVTVLWLLKGEASESS